MSTMKSADRLIGPLTIEALANGGNGIAREQGRVIFVTGAFPGDIVLCRLTKEKKNYAEAEVVELQQPSPLRRIPPCPVAEKCGGCQWQQLPYAEQLKWKQQLFIDTLDRQVGVDPALVRPIEPAPEEFAYRSRVQVKCDYSANGFVTGFFQPKSRLVIAIDQCPLMDPQLNRLLVCLRETLATSTYAQQITQIDLAIGTDNRSFAVIHYLGNDRAGLTSLLLPLAKEKHLELALLADQKKKLQMICGSGELEITVDDPEIKLKYAAGGFAQINLGQNRRLIRSVLSAADLSGDEQVLDLYCGMGNFTLPIARRAGFVVGVEDYAPSIKMASNNANRNNIANVDFYVMPAEQALQRIKKNFDLLVLDPPRAGAYAVVKQLCCQPVAKIIYVSCDPQTLARDLKTLIGCGYQVVFSQVFDMFPQTFHMESLTLLEYRSE